jgi:hypothetical protein
MAKTARAPANTSPSAVPASKRPAAAATVAATTARSRKTTARERDRDRDRKRDRTGAAKSSPKNHTAVNGDGGGRRTPNPTALGRQRNGATTMTNSRLSAAAPSPLIGTSTTADVASTAPPPTATLDAASIAAASAGLWQSAPQRVLHAYRAAHRLRAPAAQRHPLAHVILGTGIGRRAPSSRSPARGFGGFLPPPLRPGDAGGGRAGGGSSSSSGGSGEGEAGGWTRSRQERGRLASAVRRHFNSLPVSELDVLVETLYRAKTKGWYLVRAAGMSANAEQRRR